MVPLVIFVCLLIANSSSEYVTKSKLSEEAIIENLKNNIEITSSNRTDGNSKDIFQRILLKDTLMLTKDVGEILRTSPVMIFRVASLPSGILKMEKKGLGLTVRSSLRLMTKCIGDGFGYFLLQHPFGLRDGSFFILIWLSRRYDSTMFQHNQNANGQIRVHNLTFPRQSNLDKKGSVPLFIMEDFRLYSEKV